MAHHSDKAGDSAVDTRWVSDKEAAFIVGSGGKTKAKLSTVSGARIDLVGNKNAYSTGGSTLEIRGTLEQRKRAKKYIDFLIAQRHGPVNIEDLSSHNDLTILVVPADTVSYITGRAGQSLRLVEEEWGALLFFLQVDPRNRPVNVDPSRTERLAIFGPERSRRGAELRVMASIEAKQPGHFMKDLTPKECKDEGVGTDTLLIKEEDFSFVLGTRGSVRKRLSRASNCIVEYVGRLAYFYGTKKERTRAKEYLMWMLDARNGAFPSVECEKRDDVSPIMVHSSCIGFITEQRDRAGSYDRQFSALRSIEDETNTFCFADEEPSGEEKKKVLIFGRLDDRRSAETLIWDRINQRIDEVDSGAPEKGDRKGKGKGKGKDKDRENKEKDAYAGYGKADKKGGRDYGKGKKTYEKVERYERVESSSEVKKGQIPSDLPLADPANPVWTEGPGGSEFMAITDKDAAFIMGPGGKTKKKIAAVSGSEIELISNVLEVSGPSENKEKAKKYIQLVMAQRIGPVRIEDPSAHDDLTIMEVPADSVSFVTGQKGSYLRTIEELFGTLCFFIDFDKSHHRDQLEHLAIFGNQRERRGAELKVMTAIETKQSGYFAKKFEHGPMIDPSEGFGTDRLPIGEEDYSYALGKGGATRKKIARASGCIVEYVGHLAYLSGTKKERTRAREYLTWLFQQRIGAVEVNYEKRDDVTVLLVPKDCVGFVTGSKGAALRAVEDYAGAFCFIEGGRDDPQRDPKPLLIFGSPESRQIAEERFRARIEQKLVEGWVNEDGGKGGGYSSRGGDEGDYGYGGKGEKGKRRKGGKGGKDTGKVDYSFGGYHKNDGRNEDERVGSNGASYEHTNVAWDGGAEAEQRDDEDGAWGNWGGGSDDEGEGDEGGGAGGKASVSASPQKSATTASPPASAAAQPMPYYPHQGYSIAAGGSGGASAMLGPSRGGEDPELPPQLLHEEAWPELGDMGAKRKGRR